MPSSLEPDSERIAQSPQSAGIRQQARFAVRHLAAAARFARDTEACERAHAGQPFGPFVDTLTHYVSASVLLATAALEANVNELLSEPAQLFPSIGELPAESTAKLIVRLRILEKYEKIAAIRSDFVFDKGVSIYQDVASLIRLRNALVHFRPVWHDSPGKLAEELEDRFASSHFVDQSEPMFPVKFIGHGCARWAVESSLQFMELVEEKLGLPKKFEKYRGRFCATL